MAELTLNAFYAWKESHDLRNSKVGSQNEVDLTSEQEVVYFYKSTLKSILDEKPASIVIRFGCSDSGNKFRLLDAAIQGRDGSDSFSNTYLSHKALGTGPDELNPPGWSHCEEYFKERNKVINDKKYSFQFEDERGGIRHSVADFTDWFDSLDPNGEVAAYFLRDHEKTTVGFVDAGFKPLSSTTFKIFDQGNKCCP
jgi:hypothetical protein